MNISDDLKKIIGYDKVNLPPFDPEKHITTTPIYSKKEDWLHLPSENEEALVDVFWVYPTVLHDDKNWMMDINDQELIKDAAWTLVSQASIFNGKAKIYAPKYRQVNVEVLPSANQDLLPVFELGQKDVEDAFEYYLKHYNNGRPFILASHSQGSYRAIELAKKLWGKSGVPSNLIAAYVIGFSITREEIKENPGIRMCESPTDLGCFITYNSIAQGMEDEAPTLDKGTFVVNPLTWKTDEEFAPASKNIAAVFFNKEDPKNPEVYPNFSSAQVVGSGLVVDNVTHEEKIATKSKTFPQGVYHIDDYAIFYSNLRENVEDRINAFFKK